MLALDAWEQLSDEMAVMVARCKSHRPKPLLDLLIDLSKRRVEADTLLHRIHAVLGLQQERQEPMAIFPLLDGLFTFPDENLVPALQMIYAWIDAQQPRFQKEDLLPCTQVAHLWSILCGEVPLAYDSIVRFLDLERIDRWENEELRGEAFSCFIEHYSLEVDNAALMIQQCPKFGLSPRVCAAGIGVLDQDDQVALGEFLFAQGGAHFSCDDWCTVFRQIVAHWPVSDALFQCVAQHARAHLNMASHDDLVRIFAAASYGMQPFIGHNSDAWRDLLEWSGVMRDGFTREDLDSILAQYDDVGLHEQLFLVWEGIGLANVVHQAEEIREDVEMEPDDQRMID